MQRKNLRPVGGRTLLAWTVEHLRRTARPMRAIVSTDDEEIAAHALELGAEVPRLRPAELAADDSPTEPAVIDALSAVSPSGPTEAVVLLQPTSPIRFDGSIDGAIDVYEESGADSVFSVVDSPPWLWRGCNSPTPLYDIHHRPRSQDLVSQQRYFRETGSVYVTALTHLLGTANRLGPRATMYVMRPEEGIDIDDESDLVIAEALVSSLSGISRIP